MKSVSLVLLQLLATALSSSALLNSNNLIHQVKRSYHQSTLPQSKINERRELSQLHSFPVKLSDAFISVAEKLKEVSVSTPTYVKITTIAIFAILAIGKWIDEKLWTPSRTYNKEENTVGKEYDAWEEEGILEYYWGEHIHLGYYAEKDRAASLLLPPKKNFIEAKYDFIDEMLNFGRINADSRPAQILDVGCGIGGTSRYLAKKFGTDTKVIGITLSNNQMKRATELAKEQGVTNAEFLVMDALDMQFPDNSFDYVWACESGEHMPDKKRYIEEMTRVLKPGGKIVVATWCQRDEGNKPFSNDVSRCSMILGGNALNSMHIHLYIFRRRECLISCIPSGRTLSSSPSAITRS